MHKFDFSYDEYKRFLERCPFTDEEVEILNLRRKGKSRIQISMILNMSDGAVDRRIKSINEKISKEI
jgi:DNA-binding NarL/FixJ family response regulator